MQAESLEHSIFNLYKLNFFSENGKIYMHQSVKRIKCTFLFQFTQPVRKLSRLEL